jgi:4a-hydroxytetrahydrobiopterin dehydratase
MRHTRLDDAALAAALAALNLRSCEAWVIRDGTLQKNFRFKDFRTAFAFMSHVADAANTMDHHPDWCNTYNRVQVKLCTHDVGGLTELDFHLAEAMEDATRMA